jgi:type VI secretion system protein ImpI
MPVALVARVIDSQANQSLDATFERFPVRIGRNQINDLHIDRPYVSQFHAAIDLRDRQIFVKDLGSTNGTMVKGQRLARDTPVDITSAPDITIGPIVIRLAIVEATPKKRDEGTVLEIGEHGSMSGVLQRPKPVAPGAEDPYVRQVIPYIEAYRAGWGAVYRVIYDHLARLPPDIRSNYITRLGLEHPSVCVETDFQRIAQYYGVEPRGFMELGPPQAALAALTEIARALAPDTKALDDVPSVLGFARRLRDAMEVFLKSFLSLRDGYYEFVGGLIGRDQSEMDAVSKAGDAKELGNVLLSPRGDPEAVHQLHEIFVDVMSHQVALITGVMEGVKRLLVELSPKELEEQLERKGKKGGLFSSKYEELWSQYKVRHDDFASDEKSLSLIIFGPQFARAYDQTAGEDNKGPGEAGGKNLRFTVSPNQYKR